MEAFTAGGEFIITSGRINFPLMQKLRQIFIDAGLSESDTEKICSRMQENTYLKNHQLLRAGQVASKIYFVDAGAILLGQEVEETVVTRHLAVPGEFITCFESFESRKPSAEFLKTVAATRVYEVTRSDFEIALQQFPQVKDFYQKVIFETLLKCQKRIADLTGRDALSYYEKILNDNPDLVQQMPQYELASYLGIEPQSLSRLRSKKKAG